jgi:hypothetical protein
LEKREAMYSEPPKTKRVILVQDTMIPTRESPSNHLAPLTAGLEHPSQSLPFLEAYHKSALRIEALRKSLRKISVGIGLFATICFFFSLFTYMSAKFEQNMLETQKK